MDDSQKDDSVVSIDLVSEAVEIQTIFFIPTFNMPAFEEKVGALVKKSKKLGLAAPSYKVLRLVPAHVLQGSPEDFGANAFGEIHVPAKYEVEVLGSFPKMPGFEFVGVVEHTIHGNILRSMPEKVVPEELRTAKPTCDHCGHNRARTNTYVVLHTDSQELKRVGSACVKDYLGGLTPAQIAYMATFIKEIRFCESDEERESKSRGIEISTFLGYVLKIVDESGYYISRQKAQESGGSTTAEYAVSLMDDVRNKRKDATAPTPEQFGRALEMLTWARGIKPSNSFESNLQICSMKEVLTRRDFGIIAAIIPTYNRVMNLIEKKEKVVAAEETPGAFVGEVGKRAKMNLTFKRELAFDGQFGKTYMFFFEDAQGNVIAWKTGGWPHIPVKHSGEREYFTSGALIKDETYEVKATVKKFETYRGKCQTWVSRLAFEVIQAEQTKGEV